MTKVLAKQESMFFSHIITHILIITPGALVQSLKVVIITVLKCSFKFAIYIHPIEKRCRTLQDPFDNSYGTLLITFLFIRTDR